MFNIKENIMKQNERKFLTIILSFFAVMIMVCGVIAYIRHQEEKQVDLRTLSGGYESK